MYRETNTLIDPEVLAGVRDLALHVRGVVEGHLVGQHRDLRSAAGVEFRQHRSFERGDDPRRIDWRAFARNDRLLVREAEVEREVMVRFLLDASASMAHRDGAEARGMVKLDHARRTVAALAYLADRQGDRLALHAVRDGGVVSVVPARPPRWLAILDRLVQLEAAGRWPAWPILSAALPPMRGRELIVVVSDLYQADDEMLTALAALRARGHEVLVCHCLARNELAFSFRGDLIFEDLETGETVRADAEALATPYRQAVDAFVDRWRRRLLERGIDHCLMPTDEPLDHALRALLRVRGDRR